MEVFSAQGRDPAALWKLTGSVKKEYDKLVRGNVYTLEGGTSTTTTRMQLPKSERSSCKKKLCIVCVAASCSLFFFLCSGPQSALVCLSTQDTKIS